MSFLKRAVIALIIGASVLLTSGVTSLLGASAYAAKPESKGEGSGGTGGHGA